MCELLLHIFFPVFCLNTYLSSLQVMVPVYWEALASKEDVMNINC